MKKVLLTLVVIGMMMMASAVSALDAADVIFIVDESGSMSGEHAWIQDMVMDLEAGLAGKNVGTGADANRYGLVGFGGGATHLPGHEHAVGGGAWGTAAELKTAASSLIVSGGTEDGWDAINFALNNYNFRQGAAVNFILITDEDRDRYNTTLSYQSVLAGLKEKGAMLNAVVNANYRTPATTNVVGVDSEGTAYVADGSGGYTQSAGGYVYSDFGTTKENYVDMAWATGGAGWNLNQLRAGGLMAESFSKAFVDIKVEEIIIQTTVPEPGTMLLLGGGLLGLAALKRKRRS